MSKRIKKVLMTVLLIEDEAKCYEELGIASITSYLRTFDYEVLLTGIYQNNLDYSKIIDFNPDIIGITIYSFRKASTYDVCRALKELLPKALICAGGYYPSISSKDVLENCPAIDFVICGEGEYSFKQLIEAINSQSDLRIVKGLVYRDGNSIVYNEKQNIILNLDDIPFSARDMLSDNAVAVAAISSSRGCMAKCSFCDTQHMYKHWRGRSPKNVVDELYEIVHIYGVDKFYFGDCCFEDPGPDLSRMKEIAKKIIERDLKINYYADFRSDMSRKIDDETLSLLKQSGLCCAFIGIEAGNQKDLVLYGKNINIEDNHNVLRLLELHNIYTNIGFINFNPYSTLDGLYENINFLEQYGNAARIDMVISKCIINRVTPLYKKIEKDQLIQANVQGDIRYRFLHQDIETLYKYTNMYVNLIEIKTNKALNKFRRLHYTDFRLLTYLKATLHRKNDYQTYDIISKYCDNLKEVLEEVNNIIAQWFRALLHLMQMKSDYRAIENVSKKILSAEFVTGLAKKIDDLNKTIYEKIIKISPQYIQYLVD